MKQQQREGARAAASDRRWTLLAALALFVATALVFARGLGNGFVNYDDPDYVTKNAMVQQGLTVDGLRWAFTAREASNWHPLTWLSHMADVSVYGLEPWGHHATSIVLHALNAALAFLALRAATGSARMGAICAAAFALHPLRVESVAWVAERKDILSGCFFFLCVWAYAEYARRRKTSRPAVWPYVGALGAFAIGLLAKPMLVTVPCLLLVLDVWPLRRAAIPRRADSAESWGRLLLEKAPFFAFSVASSWITFVAQREGGSVAGAAVLGWAARAENAIVALVLYLGKFVWPFDLGVLYPHPGDWPNPLVFAAALALLTVTAVGGWQWRTRPALLCGWLWFVGMMVPVSGLVQVGVQAMADRYMYLPSIGLSLAIAGSLAAGVERARVLPLAISTGAVLMFWSALTVRQLGVWKDSITLFTHTLAVAGRGNYLAYDNRGVALAEAGRVDEAIADYREALAIHPDYPNANNNLGKALAERGRITDAIEHYRRAMRSKPDLLELRNNLANALSDAGEVDEAIEHYRFVLDRAPQHVNARNGYAVALAMKGRVAEAEQEFRAVLAREPDNSSALSNLGNVYAMTGRLAEAADIYQRVLAHNPQDPRTRYNLGNVFVQLGRTGAAIEEYRRAVTLQPVNPDAHAALGQLYAREGRKADALRHLRTALQQRPGHPGATAALAALGGP